MGGGGDPGGLSGSEAVGDGVATGGDDLGDAVPIGAGLAGDAQATISSDNTAVVATRDTEERMPCPPDGLRVRRLGRPAVTPSAVVDSSRLAVTGYGSMIVVVQRTVLSGAMARMLADEVLPGSGSMARA